MLSDLVFDDEDACNDRKELAPAGATSDRPAIGYISKNGQMGVACLSSVLLATCAKGRNFGAAGAGAVFGKCNWLDG